MVQVEFDKPRQLHFDLAAVRDLESALGGQPIGVIIQQLSQLGVNAMVLALWAGFKHEDRAITPNLITKRLETYLKEGKKLAVLADALSQALDECGIFATDDDEPKKTTTPTSSPSGS